jgi:DNA-binding response OmpR family regulator
MLKIVVIEDDKALAESLKKGLSNQGFDVSVVNDGLQARVLDWGRFDLVLLDWNLPNFSGIELIRQKRSSKWFGCCIMLTAKNETNDIINGLDFGVDDFLKKPFDWGELISRINACIRRRYGFGVSKLNNLEWDKDKKIFLENHNIVKLTETEYNLLSLFFQYPSRIYRKSDIIDRLYSEKDIYPDSNVIERHISKLRRKFQDDPIQTIQNMGYRLRSN